MIQWFVFQKNCTGLRFYRITKFTLRLLKYIFYTIVELWKNGTGYIRQISFVHPDMSVLVHVCLGLAQNKLFLVSVRLNIEHSMKLIGRTSNQLLKITNKSINISEIFIEKTVFQMKLGTIVGKVGNYSWKKRLGTIVGKDLVPDLGSDQVWERQLEKTYSRNLVGNYTETIFGKVGKLESFRWKVFRAILPSTGSFFDDIFIVVVTKST